MNQLIPCGPRPQPFDLPRSHRPQGSEDSTAEDLDGQEQLRLPAREKRRLPSGLDLEWRRLSRLKWSQEVLGSRQSVLQGLETVAGLDASGRRRVISRNCLQSHVDPSSACTFRSTNIATGSRAHASVQSRFEAGQHVFQRKPAERENSRSQWASAPDLRCINSQFGEPGRRVGTINGNASLAC